MAKEMKADVPKAVPAEQTPAPTGRTMGVFDDVDRFLDTVFERGWMRPFRWEHPLWERIAGGGEGRIPRVDLLERDSDVLLRAELPGVQRRDLDVSVTDATVTIRGATASEKRTEEGAFFRSEIARGAFSRTVSLPAKVDADKADARFADGILEITLPKVKEARRRRIEVR
ncbi:Hsp20/alpha crystallin family protein [Arhodomonas aquaeolei]|uniref:Hsp20/alpha crystallin family protein n=1 Tax=Arhodomonas aquaeolei TaxID=2369 RepID=UPI00038033F4|nr:Hsp20/alpha crystallin family protein [Arhodomonas aquaeolei]